LAQPVPKIRASGAPQRHDRDMTTMVARLRAARNNGDLHTLSDLS
jgi:hypothetical protein